MHTLLPMLSDKSLVYFVDGSSRSAQGKVYGWMISTQMTEYLPKVARGTAEAAVDQLGRGRDAWHQKLFKPIPQLLYQVFK